MAIVLVEINRSQPQGGKGGTQNTTRTEKPGAAKVQPVMQRAATSAAATPDRDKTAEADVPKSYMTAFLLMAALGGVYLISQYNNKK